MKSNLLFSILAVLVIFIFCGFASADSLVAHWTFDEGAGSTAYDSAGSNDGTVVGATWTTGKIGGALEFDGVNDYINMGNDNSLKPDLPVSITAWVKLDVQGHTHLIVGLDDRTTAYYGIWFAVGSSNKLSISYGDGGIKTISSRRTKKGTTELLPGIWYHVATVVKGATDMDLYINGVDDGGAYEGTGGTLAYSADGDVYVGVLTGDNSYYDGLIDDVRIYDYALDADEIAELYQPASCEPVAHWTFDEGAGPIAHDSADGHDGTVSGNPVWAAGQIDGCLDFDGNGDYVNFGDIDQFEFGNNDFAISFWFKTEGPHNFGGDQGDYGVVVGKYNYSWGRQWWFQQMPSGQIRFSTFYTDSLGESVDSQNGYKGQWVHCAGVRKGANKYLYINGVLDNSGPCHDLTTGKSTQVIVGAIQDPSKYYQFFNGKIDDVRIYRCALDANQVAQLYTDGAVNLESIEIAGPDSVPEESDTQYQVIGYYDNNSTSDLTNDANLAVAPDEFAAIDSNGLLSTGRLYRMQEACTIYADYQGLTAEKPVTIYPVCDGNQCSALQLLGRNIADAVEIKQLVREDLAYAMKIEQASVQLFSEIPKNSKPGQLNKARIHLLAALIRENWADKQIGQSIDFLQMVQEILQQQTR